MICVGHKHIFDHDSFEDKDMRTNKLFKWLIIFSLLSGGCGQGPNFMDLKKQSRDGGGVVEQTGAESEEDLDALASGENENGSNEGGIIIGDEGDPEGAGDGSRDPSDFDVPEASDDDLDALHKCMAHWKDLPFDRTINNYTKISASVTVGGYGLAVNDTERTDEPWLTLISAGVNVLGEPTYRLLNPNGYYCIKVNVNVSTKLTVELHCNARLADQNVNVNVLANQSDTTSAVGVHVLSDVEVVTVRPSGDDCVR